MPQESLFRSNNRKHGRHHFRVSLSWLLLTVALYRILPGTNAFVHNTLLSHRRQEPSGKYSFPQLRAISNENEAAAATNNTNTDTIWSREKLEEYAARQGVVVSLTTLGPLYRAVARPLYNQTLILGYVEGFVRPSGGLLHVDKMEVFRAVVRQCRRDTRDIEPPFTGGGTTLGVGLLMGYLCMLHGQEEGCDTAEFLAIDDEDRQHERLVRYYKLAGFDKIKYVGDDWKDIPDRLVWGGCGTLLRKDIPWLLAFWTKLMKQSEGG